MMSDLTEEIQEASRGRILPHDAPKDSPYKKRVKAAETKFDRISEDKVSDETLTTESDGKEERPSQA